jgi:AraC-like DNA-binding protein
LLGYVAAIRSADSLAKLELRDLVVSHVYDLVSLVLGAVGDVRQAAEEGGVRMARRAAILRDIERLSADPALTANVVAGLLGITPRYVHLILEETGKTFSELVLERRLERAAALLRDPAWRERKIVDIAAEAGFTNLSYFNRSFRRRFGDTPSGVKGGGPP